MEIRMAIVLFHLGFFTCLLTQARASTNGSMTMGFVSSPSRSPMPNTVAVHSNLTSSSDIISSTVSLDDIIQSTHWAGSASNLQQNTGAYSFQMPSESLTLTPFLTSQESPVMTVTDSPFSFQLSSPTLPFNITTQLPTVTISSSRETARSFLSITNSFLDMSSFPVTTEFRSTSQDPSLAMTSQVANSLDSSLPSSTMISSVDAIFLHTSAANILTISSSYDVSPSSVSEHVQIMSTEPQVSGHTSQSTWISADMSLYFTSSGDPRIDSRSSRLFSSSGSMKSSSTYSFTPSHLTNMVLETSQLVSRQVQPITFSSFHGDTISSSSILDSYYMFQSSMDSGTVSNLSEQSIQPKETIATESISQSISDSSPIPQSQDNESNSLVRTYSHSSDIIDSYSQIDAISSLRTSIRSDILVSSITNSTSSSQLELTDTALQNSDAVTDEQISAITISPSLSSMAVVNGNTSSLQSDSLEISFEKSLPSTEVTSDIGLQVSNQINSEASPTMLFSSMSLEFTPSFSSQIDLTGSMTSNYGQSLKSTIENPSESQDSIGCIQCDTPTTSLPNTEKQWITTTVDVSFSSPILPSQSGILGDSDHWVSSLKTLEISAAGTSHESKLISQSTMSSTGPLSSNLTAAEPSHSATFLSVSLQSPSLISRTEHNILSTDVYEYSPTTEIAFSTSTWLGKDNITHWTGMKNLTIVFSLKGECSFIMGNDYIFQEFWRSLSEYTKKSSSLPVSHDNISLMKVGCTPFHAVVFVSVLNKMNVSEDKGHYFHFNRSQSTLSLLLKNGTSLKVVITKFEVRPSNSSSLGETDENTLSEIVVITTAAVVCGILVFSGIVVFLREYLRKRGSESVKFISGFRGIKGERMALRNLSGVDRANMEMQDNGSMVFDGGYSTIGSQKGRKTTFMTQADMNLLVHSKNKKGSLRKNARNASNASAKPSSDTNTNPMRGYGLVIGLLGYKTGPTMADTYAAPSKKSKVQALSIKSTGESNSGKSSAATDKAKRKDAGPDSSPVPPPRYLRSFSRHKEVTESVERLVPSNSKADDASKEEGLHNPAYTDDEKRNDVIGSTSSVHI